MMTNQKQPVARGVRSRRARRSPLIIMATCILALVAFGGLFLSQSILDGRAARNEVRQAAAALNQLGTALSSGLDAETGQRGYLLTRDDDYLEPYRTGRASWTQDLDTLEELAQPHATPELIEKIELLRTISVARLDELERSIGYSQAGDNAALIELIRSSLGKDLMDGYRDVTAEVRSIETAILNDSLARADGIESRYLPLLSGLMLLIMSLFALLIWFERKASRAAMAEQEAEAMRRARDQADLTSRELNHRVKNLFAVITSMIRLASRDRTDPQGAFSTLRDRVHALSVAHAVTRGDVDRPVASLGELLRATLAPYEAEGKQINFTGPTALIEAKAVTPLGLIFHELATNAVKYGALSTDHARLDVSWTKSEESADQRIQLLWTESGLNRLTRPEKDGFGLTMMSASAQQVGGELKREWRNDGLETILTFPVVEIDP